MSFLKITDPAKRDFIVQEYLKTKDNVRKNYITERTGELGAQRELTKFFKPVIETQKTVAKDLSKDLSKEVTQPITSALLPITEGVRKAVELAKYPSIKAEEGDVSDTSILYLGEIASHYLRQFASKEGVDKTFGLYDKDGAFYIGDSPVEIVNDNITIKGKEYEGTPGLWELLIMKRPNNTIYTPEDLANYAEILHDTNAMKHNHNPKSMKPKSSKGQKYKEIIRPIWDDIYSGYSYLSSGNGVKTIVIPSDPNALIDRLDLLLASKQAGNTGVRNELVSICDELRRQNVIENETYKNLMLAL